jgi:acyl-CoA synthetase (AMP-forming)/AMP-acid ligase II
LTDSKTNESYSFSDLTRLLPAASRGFARLGVKFGDTVGTYMPNHLDFFVAFCGVTRMGAIISPANPLYTGDELSFQLTSSGARWTITVEALLPRLKEALIHMAGRSTEPFQHHVVMIGADAATIDAARALLAADAPQLSNVVVSAFSELVTESSEGSELVQANLEQFKQAGPRSTVCCLPFSSGTTGLPKGVRLTHYNIVANLCQCTEYGTDLQGGKTTMLHFDEQTVLLGMLPFFHIFGLVVVLFGGLFRGAHVVVMSKFEPAPFMETMVKHQITNAALVPPVLVFMAKHPMVEAFVPQMVLREIISGAAPLDANLLEACKSRITSLNVLRQGYGMTELSPVVLLGSSHHIFSLSVSRFWLLIVYFDFLRAF